MSRGGGRDAGCTATGSATLDHDFLAHTFASLVGKEGEPIGHDRITSESFDQFLLPLEPSMVRALVGTRITMQAQPHRLVTDKAQGSVFEADSKMLMTIVA